MTERQQVGGVIASYWDLLAMMRSQVATNMNISYSTLDQLAGYTDTFSTKVLADKPQRKLTPESFSNYVQTLCVDIVAYHNPEKLRKLKQKHPHLFVERQIAPAMLSAVEQTPVIIRFSRRHMRKIARKSAEARMRKIPKRRRKQIALHAARARWRKPKVVEVKTAAKNH